MSRQPLPHRTRGSLLIVAMLLAAVFGIALVSYLRIGQTNMEVANRSFYNNAAVNLAETGLEQAMWSINKMVAGAGNAWDGWDTPTVHNARRKWTGTDFGQGTTGQVRVYVSNYDGTGAPTLYSRATITPSRGANIEKWIQVQLRKRSKFANGLVAKDSITFNGNNATVDSWNSDPDKNPATASIPYSNAVRNDKGSVGSISVSVSAVAINNADIWGYAATGGAPPVVGNNGSVLGHDSPSGVKVDSARVSTDFTANFDPITTPTETASIGAITSDTTLGTTGVNTTITCTSVIFAGSETLEIRGNVTLIVTDTTKAIEITGNAGINIPSGATLKIYTAGSLKIAGNGVANSNTQPVTLQIYGTSTSTTSTQDIQIAGNGDLKGVVYAPNGDVKVNGNGNVMGSVVAKNITLTGNATFHYDESLADFDSGSPYGITRWQELTTATQRSGVSSLLDF
ncbi:MAG: hypothetical protein HZA31_10810 [Opitutae bacterium]|nr:hypothetical protein [Opitutae bacterium]